jgi:transcription antitermination factor NusG
MDPSTHERLLWFALRVRPRHDKTVSLTLRNNGFEECLPLYRARHKWADRFKMVDLPLFPGYVFCRFDPSSLLPILNTPGVIDIVRAGRVLLPISDCEVAGLQRLAKSGLHSEPSPYLQVGQRVRIEGGPLFGLEGLLVEIRNSLRLVLSVDLLQRSVLVEIDRDWVDSSKVRPSSTVFEPETLNARIS